MANKPSSAFGFWSFAGRRSSKQRAQQQKQKQTQTDTQTHRHTDTQTHRHTDTQTHRHTDTQTHTHTHTHNTHTHTHNHNTNTNTNTKTQTQKHKTNTHTHTHIHTLSLSPSLTHLDLHSNSDTGADTATLLIHRSRLESIFGLIPLTSAPRDCHCSWHLTKDFGIPLHTCTLNANANCLRFNAGRNRRSTPSPAAEGRGGRFATAFRLECMSRMRGRGSSAGGKAGWRVCWMLECRLQVPNHSKRSKHLNSSVRHLRHRHLLRRRTSRQRCRHTSHIEEGFVASCLR